MIRLRRYIGKLRVFHAGTYAWIFEHTEVDPSPGHGYARQIGPKQDISESVTEEVLLSIDADPVQRCAFRIFPIVWPERALRPRAASC